MIITKLETREQFNKVDENSLLIVQWGAGSHAKHLGETITAGKVYEVKPHYDEVIVRIKDNLYFNIQMYLDGKSGAKEVYLVEDEKA